MTREKRFVVTILVNYSGESKTTKGKKIDTIVYVSTCTVNNYPCFLLFVSHIFTYQETVDFRINS